MTVLFLIFLDQICQKWIKLDQIGFLINLKMLLLQVVTFTERMKMAVLFLIFLYRIRPKFGLRIKTSRLWADLLTCEFSWQFVLQSLMTSLMDATWNFLVRIRVELLTLCRQDERRFANPTVKVWNTFF